MTSDTMRIRFLRTINASSQNDDIVTIRTIDTDLYKLTFQDANCRKSVSKVLHGKDIFRWLRIMLRTVEHDSDPFDSIQFDVPTMPSFLIATNAIEASYHTILDAIEFHLNLNLTLEQEYVDMPPLVYALPPGSE